MEVSLQWPCGKLTAHKSILQLFDDYLSAGHFKDMKTGNSQEYMVFDRWIYFAGKQSRGVQEKGSHLPLTT